MFFYYGWQFSDASQRTLIFKYKFKNNYRSIERNKLISHAMRFDRKPRLVIKRAKGKKPKLLLIK